MKLLIALLAICASTFLHAQYTFTLNIVTTMGKPLPDTEVKAVNGDLEIVKKTNISGSVTFELVEPGTYSFSYLDQKDVASFEVKEGYNGNSRKTITYDPEGTFALDPTVDRSKVNFKTVNGFHHLNSKTPDAMKVVLFVMTKSRRGVPSQEIQVVSPAEGLIYEGKTDGSGKATFYLRMNAQYDIDIDGIEGFQTFKLPTLDPLGTYTEGVFFEKTRIAEQIKGDTIIQSSIKERTGTSTHVLFTLNLQDYDGIPLADEPVYARADEGNRIYQGITDETGRCTFLLKKGVDYFIDLKYESDIAYIECRGIKGFARYIITRAYRGSEAVEQMLADRKTNEKGFIVNHQQTPIRLAPEPTGYLSRTSDGYKLDFDAHGPSSTPTIVGDNLYTASCYYCPEFYCLDANTGAYKWGIILGESGISPAVYHDGVILINTESCTLYAIDAETGELLWSKWLAGYLYTTPSADKSSVYVVYNNGGYHLTRPGIQHVLASFDLRTGNVNWMQWLDNEAIACPVVYEDEVHVSSLSGTYSVFNCESGDLKMETKNVRAISSPTVTANGIFLTVRSASKEQLVVLDRKNLNITRRYDTDLDPNMIVMGESGLFEHANFNGSHPIVYKNEKVLVLDKNKLRVFDAQNETLLWEKDVDAHANQIPIVANGQVLVATNDGTVMSYSLENGSSKEIARTEKGIEGQPIAHSKRLIITAAGVVSVIQSIVNPNWKQWNKDAQHNLLLE